MAETTGVSKHAPQASITAGTCGVYKNPFTCVGKLFGFSQSQLLPCSTRVTLSNQWQSLPLTLSEKKSTAKGLAKEP